MVGPPTGAVEGLPGLTTTDIKLTVTMIDRFARGRGRPVSDLEVEAAFLQLLIFSAVEAVEPGGPMGDVLLHFVQGDEEIHAQDLLAKITFIEGLAQDRLIKALQL